MTDTLSDLTSLFAAEPSTALYCEGPLDCDICFVGEAPGETEVRLGRPFAGVSGQLFDTMLYKARILRGSCRIDNVLQFRPADNNITPYIEFKSATRVIESPAFKQARTALLERLSQCSAKVIVPLGNVALYALTGLQGIFKYRGSIMTSALLPGRKIIPTIHPSAALREYKTQHLVQMDLSRIREQSAFSEVRLLQRNFNLNPSFDEAIAYIDSCNALPAVAFDIEVPPSVGEMTHFALAKSPTDAMCIPLFENHCDIFTPDHEATLLKHLSALLANPQVLKIGQNISYELTFLHNRYGFIIRPVEDCMVATGIIYPDFKKDLGFIVSIYCNGEPYFKDEGKQWFKNALEGDLHSFRRYNAMDSAVLMEIFPQQVNELKRLGNYETYRYQTSLIEPLVFMQATGISMDEEGLTQAYETSGDRIVELTSELHHLCGYPLNINSPQQVKEYFYTLKKLPPHHKTVKDKTGKRVAITCDEKALKMIAGRGFKEAQLILDIRRLTKMRSTYYNMTLDAGRMSCSYNPVGTKYGRISSRKTIFGTGANMLNQPKEIKRFMLADEGYILVELDLSQAENRLVAYIANVPRMIHAFETGQDVHSLTAALIFNKQPSEISREKGSTDIGGGRYSERDIGKKANHAFNYGLGVDGFARQLEISRDEAAFIRSRYHSIYPEIIQWHNAIQEQLRMTHRLTNPYGRTYLFLDRWGEQMFKSAYSFIPQSTVPDKITRDGIDLMYYNQDLFGDAILLNTVYDSIWFEFPIALGPEAFRTALVTLRDSLNRPVMWKGRSIVIPSDIKFGLNLADRVEKKQEDGSIKISNPRGMQECKPNVLADPASFATLYEGVVNASVQGLD